MQTLTNQTHESFRAMLDLLWHCRQVTVLTGAGCSTRAGIPDYRDRNGEWKRRQPIQYQAFMNSRRARQLYWSRSMVGWPLISRATPSAAHLALAALERLDRVRLLVTQNVDGLHQKAGSQDIVELHGGLDQVRCVDCGARSSRQTLQTRLEHDNPHWKHRLGVLAPDGDADFEPRALASFEIPDCEACGGRLKPDVVFFGESVPKARVETVTEAIRESDALLVAGSSLMVYSGWRFVRQAHRLEIPVLIVNQGFTRGDPEARLKLDAECGEVLSGLVTGLTKPAGEGL